MLAYAINSVQAQTHPVEAIIVAQDVHHEGAGPTRNRAGRMSRTTFTAWLDDDDQFMPHHIEHLLACVEEHGADVVSSYFEVVGGTDPLPPLDRGRQYGHVDPPIFTIGWMVRTELLHEATDNMGGFQRDPDSTGAYQIQDKPLVDELYRLSGGNFFSSPEATYRWFHHRTNTSGLPTRWK